MKPNRLPSSQISTTPGSASRRVNAAWGSGAMATMVPPVLSVAEQAVERADAELDASEVQLVLVWMDLEMTGLDPATDVIVEVATLVTDDELGIIAEGPDLVIHQPEEALESMDPIVVEMHTKSGLLEAIRASPISLVDAGAATLEFIRTHAPEPRSVPLCGNSIGTDRRFLARYLPEIEAHLHYRSIDVSSVKELVRRWYPKIAQGRPQKVGQHRALDDIRESIDELRYYRDRVFVPRPSAPSEEAG
jgi:oligoribonuclease